MMIRNMNLKEDKVNEIEEEIRAVEPEKVVGGLNQWCTLYYCSSFLNP